MASGSFTKQVGNRKNTENEYIKVWWESTPDAANNKSKVRAYAKMYRPWYIAVDYDQEIQMWIDGTKYTASRYGWRGSGWTEAYIDKTKTVTHNSDGTKSVYIRVKTQVKAWLREWVGWVDTGEQLCKLDNLARKSSFTINKTSATIGDSISVTLNRSSSSVRHAISIKVGSITKTILSKSSDNGSTGTYSYTLSAADLLPAMSSKSVTAKITVTTYNGSTSLGSNEKTFTLKIRDTDKPIINSFDISVVPVSPNTIKDIFVLGKSKAQITINATPTDSTGGKIVSYRVAIGNANGQLGSFAAYKNNVITTPIFNVAGQGKIGVYAIDARGSESAIIEKEIEIYPYQNPSILSFAIDRCTEDGTPDKSGMYINFSSTYMFYSCNYKNSAVVTLMKRAVTDSNDYQLVDSWQLTADNAVYSKGSISNIYAGYSIDSSYDFKLIISDSFGMLSEAFSEIGTEEMLVDLAPDGVGIGKIVERERAFEVGWDSYLENVILNNGAGIYATKSDNTTECILKLDSNDDVNINNIGKDIRLYTGREITNSSGYTYYDGGALYINNEPFAPKQYLWSGTWEKGSTQFIHNANRYRMFLLSIADTTENHGTIIPAIKNTVVNKDGITVTMIRGIGGYVAHSTNSSSDKVITDYTYQFNAEVVATSDLGETWNFIDCTWIYHGNEIGHGERKHLNIVKVEGLI